MVSIPEDDDDARGLHDRLKNLFCASQPGRDDAPALQEVRRLCLNARRRIGDAHCDAQLRQLERYARFFFSREAHEQWARDTAFGGDGLRGLVLQLLSGIELRLSQIEAQLVAANSAGKAEARHVF